MKLSYVRVLASTGYAAVFASVAATAYAGRSWTSPTAGMALLALAGAAAVVVLAYRAGPMTR
ncbi:hypothetical protein [Phytohabitans houttuyneae]|uniref:hypothetical protein n=1 Tax=Phytohabitans houttuyneae TaxID=1076126 RepID=UPI0015653244|nr:hypothetical protein [Phytohabitans houttuyneae]